MKYRKEIDGLRALAVIPIILFHAGFANFSGGFVGVDIFFVISGYLITNIIVDELEKGSFSLLNFYERRARRILPALFFVMLCALPFAWFWMPPMNLKRFSQSLVAVPLFSSNILFYLTSGYFETASHIKPLLHTWSLAVEEQFYVLFPLFLMLTWKLGKKWIIYSLIIITIISLFIAQWTSIKYPSFAFYMLPTRGFEILTGALISLYVNHKSITISASSSVSQSASLIGLLLILYAIFTFDSKTQSPSLYTLIPIAGSALIILFSNDKNIVGKFLGSKLFVAVGLISYSTYLWHQPLFAFIRLRTIDEPSTQIFIFLSLGSILLGFISWRFIEAPFRNRSKIQINNIIYFGILITILFITVGLIGNHERGFATRNVELNKASKDMFVFEKNVKECWGLFENTPTIKSACILGEKNNTPIFALLGDSHAGIFINELNDRAKSKSISGVNYSYRSCLPINNVYPKNDKSSGALTCSKIKNSFFQSLNNDKQIPNIVIISARWNGNLRAKGFDNKEGGVEGDTKNFEYYYDIDSTSYSNSISINIKNSIEQIINSGRKVILIYPIPEMGWDVSLRLSKIIMKNGSLEPSDGSISYNVYTEDSKKAFNTLDSIGSYPNLIRVRPDLLFCNTFIKERCIAHISGTPIYFDSNHLSDYGASILIDKIMENII